MSTFYLLPDDEDQMVWMTSVNTTVTVSGSVEAFNGAALRRMVYVFQDKNLTNLLASGETTMPGGTFSFEISGHPDEQFTVVVGGEAGENTRVYAHCEEP